MPTQHYLYIPESGPCFIVRDQPTKADVDNVAVNVIRIVRLSDLHWMNCDGEWRESAQGVIVAPVIDGYPTEPMHAAPP